MPIAGSPTLALLGMDGNCQVQHAVHPVPVLTPVIGESTLVPSIVGHGKGEMARGAEGRLIADTMKVAPHAV